MQNDDLGTIFGFGPSRRVELTRTLPHPIDTVWHALTDAEALSNWFAPATIEPREGGTLTLTFGDDIVTGHIKVFRPPYVLSFVWHQEGESDSLTQVDLMRMGDAETRLTIIQTELDANIACNVAAGWHIMVERLGDNLATDTHAPLDKDRETALFAAYQAAFT